MRPPTFALRILTAHAIMAMGCGSGSTGATTRIGCPDCTILTSANVFDGVNDGPGTVVIRGERVEALHRGSIEITDGNVVALPGRTILPGLIDAHVHIRPAAGPVSMSDPGNEVHAHFKAFLRAGVTTVVDLGTEPHRVFEYRRRIRDSELLAPSLLAAGPGLTPSGGHPCYDGRPSFGLCAFVDDAASANLAMSDLAASSPDVIKVIIESGTTKNPLPEIGLDTLATIRVSADALGVQVVAHVAETADMVKALDAGVRLFAHLPVHDLIDAELASRLAAEHAVVIPTAVVVDARYRVAHGELSEVEGDSAADDIPEPVLQAWRDPSRYPDMTTDEARKESARRRTNILENIRVCHAAGVPIVAGTDAGNPATFHGISMRSELALYLEAGLTEREALESATSVAAKAMGLSDRGYIAKGARADLLVVHGNPTSDLTALRNVELVYRSGERLEPAVLSVAGSFDLERRSTSGVAEGSVCLADDECAAGNTCTALGWCRAICSESAPCPSGRACFDMDTLTGEAYCEPGDACDPIGQDCPNNIACVWLGAGVTRCWYPGKGIHGEPCSSWGMCAPGFMCDTAENLCRRICDPASDGSACDDGLTCFDRAVDAGLNVGECR